MDFQLGTSGEDHWQRAPTEVGTIAVSDAKRKLYAKRLILISALLLLIFSIVAIYNGAASLYRYVWWSQNYNGDYTDSGMWTESAVSGYLMVGGVFLVVGILGIICGLILWFKCLPAVAEDNRAYLRKLLLPIAIIGFFAGPVVVFFLVLFTWLMYRDDRYDFFGLLLEDVTRTKRRAPTPMAAPTPAGDGRNMYATGYQEQSSLYSDDYAQAAYGGGAGAYTAGTGQSLVDTQPAPAPTPARAPAGPAAPPACKNCGKPTEWIEEYGRYYCYDCDAYV